MRRPTRTASSTHSCMLVAPRGTNGTTSVAPMRGCSPRCASRSISCAAHAVARKAASATGPGGPAIVSTMRLWTASACRSSTAAPRTLAAAAWMASITAGWLPSLKLGTHSTRPVANEPLVPLPPLNMISLENALNHSAQDSILDLSVRELLERLGSSDPAPGGGAAAALAGALGAALVQMTANLSIGRPKLADIEAHARRIEAQTAELRQRLAQLGDADAQAYARVSAAYKLPHQDPAQDTERSPAIQAALHEAAAVPLETARLCAAVLELAELAAPLLNRSVISDVMVGALLAQAALESAALNVEVNLAAITDAGAAHALQLELDRARSGSAERLARTLDSARSRLSKS